MLFTYYRGVFAGPPTVEQMQITFTQYPTNHCCIYLLANQECLVHVYQLPMCTYYCHTLCEVIHKHCAEM